MSNADRIALASARIARRTLESLRGGLVAQDARDLLGDARVVARLTGRTVDSVLDAAVAVAREAA